ncbi:MAG: R.Pab1 family restriction endonuclease [Thermodesulfovibrio sp.]|nr:R.Pab1 family restriction endonuclease [Thermodesulfovibrio sp.]
MLNFLNMLRVSIDKNNKEIKIGFELKNKGKFRLKKFELSGISSTYSPIIKKDDISGQDYYIEWQISYYIKLEDTKDYPRRLWINKEVELPQGKRVYPAELFGILCLAVKNGIIDKGEVKKLIRWIASVKEENLLDKTYLKHTIHQKCAIQIMDLRFETAVLELPYCVLKNDDGTWIEIIMQKQQYAYSFQPMVYLCLPHTSLKVKCDYMQWIVNKQSRSSIINTLKVFSITSKRHREDLCKIMEVLFPNIMKY